MISTQQSYTRWTIFEVNPKVIANVRDGTTWKHVSDSAT